MEGSPTIVWKKSSNIIDCLYYGGKLTVKGGEGYVVNEGGIQGAAIGIDRIKGSRGIG